MRLLKIIILFFIGIEPSVATCQTISTNFCDSLVLTKSEFANCKNDSIYTNDIITKTNYISSLKTALLPNYRLQRNEIKLPNNLKGRVKKLKAIYDFNLRQKLYVFETNMDKKQLYVQPKAYISSLISFQFFRFYPDVYAILLNEIHLQLNPKTTTEALANHKKLFDDVLEKIPSKLYKQLEIISTTMQAEKAKLLNPTPLELFKGEVAEDYGLKCNIVNFLLWTE